MQSSDGWEWRQHSRLLSRGGHGLSTAKSPARGESPRAHDPIALEPSITAWRLAYQELAKDLQSSAELRQRGCIPVPVRSRWGDPTMPPHHVKVPGPRGWRGWRGGEWRTVHILGLDSPQSDPHPLLQP